MIKPVQKNQELVQDIASFTQNDGFKVWWLGQSGFLLKYKNKSIIFDPYLSESLSIKYAGTDKPHTRVSELVLQPGLLRNIDVVTSSHNHTDHLDADTLLPIFKNNEHLSFIIPEANRAFVADRLNCENTWPVGLNDDMQVERAGFTIIGIPAAHNIIDRDENGNLKCMGFIVKFGHYSIYHSGDTLWYDGLREILLEHKLDLAFLPINGDKPERRVSGNLNYEEAARLGKEANIKCVVPHHYDLFSFNTEDPTRFEEKCIEYGTPFRTFKLGQGIEF